MKQVANRIREAREQRGMSQVELAAAVNVTQAAISAIETGRVVSPSVDLARSIADVLGATIDFLFPMDPAA